MVPFFWVTLYTLVLLSVDLSTLEAGLEVLYLGSGIGNIKKNAIENK